MIYTDMTKLAMNIAYEAHKNQMDKAGVPYIFHPIHLAEEMTEEISVCAALLHDVAEDTPLTIEDLSRKGMPDAVTEALRLLTHDEAVPYLDYVRAIKQSGNMTAISVKLADLRHNSDLSRLDSADEKALNRIEKYKAAIAILEDG